MRVELDTGKCAAHGECVIAAPGVFALEDFDIVAEVTEPEPAEERRDEVVAAAEACPTRAITIHD